MPDLRVLGATSCGVTTRRQVLTVLSSGQVDAFVRSRVWQVVWRGVDVDSGHELDAERRAWAAVLAVGGALPAPAADGASRLRLRAVASGRTAARVWRLPLVDDDPGHSSVRNGTSRTSRWTGTCHRSTWPADR